MSISGEIGRGRLCFARGEVRPPPRGRPHEPHIVGAIIDTGAEGTVVSERVADAIELPMLDAMPVALGFGEPVVCTVVAGDVVLLGDESANRHAIYAVTMPLIVARGDFEGRYDVLLGADAFAGGSLHIDYRGGRWAFVYEGGTDR